MWAIASHLMNPDLHHHIYAPKPHLCCLSVDGGHLATVILLCSGPGIPFKHLKIQSDSLTM